MSIDHTNNTTTSAKPIVIKRKDGKFTDEQRLRILKYALDVHKKRLESMWNGYTNVATELNTEHDNAKSELGLKLSGYTVLMRSIASMTIRKLEERGFIAVTGSRKELLLDLAASPIFILGSESVITNILDTSGEKCADA